MVSAAGILLAAITFIAPFFRPGERKPLDSFVSFFIFSMIISSFMALVYWDQSLMTSFTGYKFFYIYFLYFIFVIFEVSPARVERIIMLFFFTTLVIFFIGYVTFPDPLFSYRSEERRNGITIFFYGHGFTFLGAFYFLGKFFEGKKIIHFVFFVLAAYCLFLLTQSRMNLLALAGGFFLMLLFSDLKKKYLFAVLIIIAGAIFYTTAGVFDGIKEASRDQTQFYKEDIRVLAYNYFLTDFQGGVPTMIFGNGFPVAGSKLEFESIRGNLMGFWTADVGLLGIYSYFGLLGVIAWLLFFYAAFKVKNTPNTIYLKAYFFALLTSAFFGYSIFDPGYMPATIMALYMLRCEIINQQENNLKSDDEDQLSANYTDLEDQEPEQNIRYASE